MPRVFPQIIVTGTWGSEPLHVVGDADGKGRLDIEAGVVVGLVEEDAGIGPGCWVQVPVTGVSPSSPPSAWSAEPQLPEDPLLLSCRGPPGSGVLEKPEEASRC
jgi:hypothetical protein